jgi:hypothetical protein
MDVRLGDTIYLDFTTHNPVTGAVSNADATPTAEVFEDATDAEILTPTVVIRAAKTGNYRVPVAATTGNGFEIGKTYNVVVQAIAGGVTAKSVLATIIMYPARVTGTVLTDTANSATTFKTDLTNATTDYYKDAFLLFLEGASLAGQVKRITGYDGATKFLTTEAFTGTPVNTDKFQIING